MKIPQLKHYLHMSYKHHLADGGHDLNPLLFAAIITPLYIKLKEENAFSSKETFVNFMCSNYKKSTSSNSKDISDELLKEKYEAFYNDLMTEPKDIEYYLRELVSILSTPSVMVIVKDTDKQIQLNTLISEAKELLHKCNS